MKAPDGVKRGDATRTVCQRSLVAMSPQGAPRFDEISVDGRVLSFTLIVAAATGIVFGLVPALQTTKNDLKHSLKEGRKDPRGGASAHRLRGEPRASIHWLLCGANNRPISTVRHPFVRGGPKGRQEIGPAVRPWQHRTPSFLLISGIR